MRHIDSVAIAREIDKVISGGRARAVFLLGEQMVSCPEGGKCEKRLLSNKHAVFVGVYDCEATPMMLQEDIESISSHSTVQGMNKSSPWSALLAA